MGFRKLLWTFPLAVALHNCEEAIWMPGWDARHAGQLPVQAPGAGTIRFALAALTVAGFVVSYLSWRRGPGSVWAYLTFGYIVAMLVNVFVPHVPAAIWFRSYVPGLVTAVLINLPLMSMLAVQAVREGWVSGWRAAAFGVGVPLIGGGAVAAFMTMV